MHSNGCVLQELATPVKARKKWAEWTEDLVKEQQKYMESWQIARSAPVDLSLARLGRLHTCAIPDVQVPA